MYSVIKWSSSAQHSHNLIVLLDDIKFRDFFFKVIFCHYSFAAFL